LSTYSRTAKIGFDRIAVYKTAVMAQWQGETAQRNFSRKQRNGNGEMATAEQQRNGGNRTSVVNSLNSKPSMASNTTQSVRFVG